MDKLILWILPKPHHHHQFSHATEARGKSCRWKPALSNNLRKNYNGPLSYSPGPWAARDRTADCHSWLLLPTTPTHLEPHATSMSSADPLKAYSSLQEAFKHEFRPSEDCSRPLEGLQLLLHVVCLSLGRAPKVGGGGGSGAQDHVTPWTLGSSLASFSKQIGNWSAVSKDAKSWTLTIRGFSGHPRQSIT